LLQQTRPAGLANDVQSSTPAAAAGRQQKKKKTNKKNKEEKNQTKQQDYTQLKCNQNNLTYSHHGWPPW